MEFIYRYKELEERTTRLAKAVVRICQELPRNKINDPLVSQIVRSSGSVGANYCEANDAMTKKDKIHKMRIARTEAKETCHWLEILTEANSDKIKELSTIAKEADELRKILSSIILKLQPQ